MVEQYLMLAARRRGLVAAACVHCRICRWTANVVADLIDANPLLLAVLGLHQLWRSRSQDSFSSVRAG